MATKRVAVIGAGPSGLVTVKELLEEGHKPTCLEQATSLGGVFRFAEREGVVWESCRLTSSGALTAFSDFPIPADRTGHPLASEYAGYLTRYAEMFGLARHIRFGTRVASVARETNGSWLVRTIGPSGAERVESYDAVAICSGLHQHPHLPTHPGQDAFTGEIIHGSQYRRPEQVAGKRVLVVGGGESGGDIAAEVSGAAVETVLSLRRGIAVLPRRRHGWPNDYRTCRVNNSPAPWIFQTRHPADRWKKRIYTAAFLPAVVVDKLVQSVATVCYEYLPLLDCRQRPAGRTAAEELATRLRMRRVARRLLQESGGTIAENFGTKGEDFVRAIATGYCRRACPIVRFDGGRVDFEDGASFDPDLVIYCTGFEPRVAFLEGTLADGPRFLHLIKPTVGADLGFIGFVRPAYGAIPPLAELQARYFALLQSGKVALPPTAEIGHSIERQQSFRRHFFRAVTGRLDHLVDFTSFSDELASRVGCKPSLAAIRSERPAFRRRFFGGPFVAAQYRLVGPHAKPEIARQVITNLPISHPKPMLSLYYLRWTLSRLLHRVLGDEFAPKLTLQAR